MIDGWQEVALRTYNDYIKDSLEEEGLGYNELRLMDRILEKYLREQGGVNEIPEQV